MDFVWTFLLNQSTQLFVAEDACVNDSGGPLVYRNNGEDLLIGAVRYVDAHTCSQIFLREPR